jgi:hypothetical protein
VDMTAKRLVEVRGTIAPFRYGSDFWVPHGYERIRDSLRRIVDAMKSGRNTLVDPASADEQIEMDARTAIWRAVDARCLSLTVFGRQKEPERLSPEVTRAVPFLRSKKVLSLVFLRPAHPLYQEFVIRLGIGFPRLAIGFEIAEIERLERQVRRASPRGSARGRGRPPITGVQDAVRAVVDGKRWDTSKSLKILTRKVSRHLKRSVSDDTVGRAVDTAYEETGDTRYRRVRREPRPSRLPQK